jgi:CheY-like chemotaxis protein
VRILVVDDDADLVELLGELLAAAGHRVEVAVTVEEGLERSRELHPDVTFCDLNVGAPMVGLEVARRLRAEPATADSYLVALTGADPSRCEAQTREAGFDCVLRKPISLEVVEDILAEHA